MSQPKDLAELLVDTNTTTAMADHFEGFADLVDYYDDPLRLHGDMPPSPPDEENLSSRDSLHAYRDVREQREVASHSTVPIHDSSLPEPLDRSGDFLDLRDSDQTSADLGAASTNIQMAPPSEFFNLFRDPSSPPPMPATQPANMSQSRAPEAREWPSYAPQLHASASDARELLAFLREDEMYSEQLLPRHGLFSRFTSRWGRSRTPGISRPLLSKQDFLQKHLETLKLKNDGKRCDICYEEYDKKEHAPVEIIGLKGCKGHVFGKNCLEKWLDTPEEKSLAKTCPMCRTPLCRASPLQLQASATTSSTEMHEVLRTYHHLEELRARADRLSVEADAARRREIRRAERRDPRLDLYNNRDLLEDRILGHGDESSSEDYYDEYLQPFHDPMARDSNLGHRRPRPSDSEEERETADRNQQRQRQAADDAATARARQAVRQQAQLRGPIHNHPAYREWLLQQRDHETRREDYARRLAGIANDIQAQRRAREQLDQAQGQRQQRGPSPPSQLPIPYSAILAASPSSPMSPQHRPTSGLRALAERRRQRTGQVQPQAANQPHVLISRLDQARSDHEEAQNNLARASPDDRNIRDLLTKYRDTQQRVIEAREDVVRSIGRGGTNPFRSYAQAASLGVVPQTSADQGVRARLATQAAIGPRRSFSGSGYATHLGHRSRMD